MMDDVILIEGDNKKKERQKKEKLGTETRPMG